MLEEDTVENTVARAPRRRARDTLTAFGAFLIYAAASVAIWGGTATMHLSTYYIPRQDSADSYLFRWALEWFPWAITHGRDPLASGAIFAPAGASLTWVTIVPGPALFMWPVTSAFGSLVSLNVLTLLAPALDGWAAFLLCRRLTRSFWASLAGGVFFGFSGYVAHQMNHPNLSLAFPIPILVYLTVRRLEDSLRRWAYVGLMSLTLVGLWSISLEVFATTTMFGGIALVIAFLIGRADRAKLWSTTLQIGVAYLITTAVVFFPYLLPALRIAPQGVMRVKDRTSDVLRLVFPGEPRLMGGSWLDALGNRYGSGLAYLGIGALVIIVGFAITEWRHRYARAILAFAGIAVLFALGPTLMVANHRLMPLPIAALRPLPLLQQAIPSRMMVYVHLAVAVIVALWLAAPGGRFIWARWVIVIAAAASLVPVVPSPPWHVPDTTPAFFTDGEYRSAITPGETVLLIPAKGGQQMAWQATTDFWFRMPNGHVGITRQGIPEDPYMGKLQAGGGHAPSADELRGWLDQHGVTAIVVEDSVLHHFDELLVAAGYALVEQTGGVSVWRPSP